MSKDTVLWISIASGLLLLLGVIAIPWIVVRLPEDFFSNPKRQGWLDGKPAALRIPLRIVKNVLALVLVVLGVAMLVLPGQGLLTILLGVMLADFPGKTALQQRLLTRPRVLNSLNWLRRKFHRPPLCPPRKTTAA